MAQKNLSRKRPARTRHQPRVPGGRDQLASCVVGEIAAAVERDRIKHGVGRSWIIAVILARHYKIDIPVY